MQFDELIRQFRVRVGYPATPPLDGDGAYSFTFDNLSVACREQEGMCLMTGIVGPSAGEGSRREEILRRLLQVSLVRAARACGVLTLDRARGVFVLYHRFDCRDMGPAEFEEQMDLFLNELEFWVEQARRELGPSETPMIPLGLKP